jgi:hypothetical protein
MTKIKLNLRDLLVDALGGETTHIPATVDVGELLEFNDIYETDYDIGDLLHANRMIAHIWTIEDVRSVRSDLSDDQAWAVLQRVDDKLDSTNGIDWDVIDQAAHDLFGTSVATRVERCEAAIQSYSDDLPESNFIDLMADAMHWCKAKGQSFDSLLATARTHFDTETPSE